MVQTRKTEVKNSICQSALLEIATCGYRKATIANIARRANVATGNVYRYFKDKDELFAAIIPDTFLSHMLSLMDRKIQALDQVDDITTLPQNAPYHLISQELMDFLITNRLRVIILLIGAESSRHEGFADKVITRLKKRAVEHFRTLNPDFSPTRPQKTILDLAYRNLMTSTSRILSDLKREADIRDALKLAIRYHLAGLRAAMQSL